MAVVAALGVALALGLWQALVASPWLMKDERAHTGYIMALAVGELPSVDTPIAVPRGAVDLEGSMAIEAALQAERGSARRNRVWVANHPPGPYLVSAPSAWVLQRGEHGNTILAVQRVANVLAAVAAIGFTALLAREITGSTRAAALTAGLCAPVPYLGTITSLGLTDGPGLAAVVGVTWAATRAVRRGFDRGSTALIAGLAVACGLARLTALVTAAVVVLVALVVTSWRRRQPAWRPALAITAPVVVLSGWFYALNLHRYGDPAASDVLLDRYDRERTGSVLATAFDVSLWDRVVRTLLAGRSDPAFTDIQLGRPWETPQAASTIGLVVVAVALVVLLVRLLAGLLAGHRRGADDTPHPEVEAETAGGPFAEPAGWLLLAVAVVANWLMTAQHVSGGGNPHARYLLLLVPAAACVVGSALEFAGRRLERRLSPGAAAAAVSLLPLAILTHNVWGLSEYRERSVRPAGWFSTGVRLGPDWAQQAAVAFGALAAVVYLAANARAWTTSVSPGARTGSPGTARTRRPG